MATVLRLKRLLSDDPAEVIVVHSKRLKADDGNEPCEESNLTPKPKYFTLIGTIKDDANEKIQELLFKAKTTKSSRPTYSEWRENSAKRRFNDGAKRKAPAREVNQEKKLKLVSCSRGTEDLINDVDATAHSLYKLYDVIEEQDLVAVESEDHATRVQKPVISCNGIPLVTESTNETAYDLYYAPTDDVDDMNILDNIVRIDTHLMDEEEQLCVTVEVSSDEGDEDSNEESNWKNEYPDEDDDFEKEYDYYRDYDDDEEEILDMIQSCNMKDDMLNGSDGSSEMPANSTDHDHGYDYRYSRFKLQMMRELGENLSSSDDDSV